MGWFSRLFGGRRARKISPSQESARKLDSGRKRKCRFEPMEQRRLLAITPIVVGATYVEDDSGHDLHGDTFEIKFEGGAPGTELSRLIIDTDHAPKGYSVGDLIFDTSPTGLGADEAVPFQIVSQVGISKVSATLEDGGTRLVLDFEGFQAGEKLVFTVDVDEIQQFDPGIVDVQLINEGVDPIASGVEFQSSTMTATFKAPHYYDANGTGEFRNVYDRLFQGTGLLRSEANPNGLPFDNYLGLRDRSTGAALPLTQRLLPVSVSGYVYHDINDNGLRQPGEAPIAGVPIRLEPLQTLEPQSSISVVTDAQGFYKFEGISPGTYRIVETVQPAGLLDGKDAAGTIRGVTVGTATNPGDKIESVILAGGDVGIEYNFGEIDPGAIRGRVMLSGPDGDCAGPRATPLADVKVQLFDADGRLLATTSTNAGGEYEFGGLAPGNYRIVESTPSGTLDGDEHVGTVRSVTVGRISANDTISEILIRPGDQGIDYDFCEHLAASISGFVYHDQDNNGVRLPGDEPISAVRVELRDAQGTVVGVQVTDERGAYLFSGIPAGLYQVSESQPANWRDGIDTAGTILGKSVGIAGNDQIGQIQLVWGAQAIDYNFGELLPGSIEGFVHLDLDEDCEIDEGEQRLSGVTIQLLDRNGVELATTETDSRGHYIFDNLAPGTYQVRELQPAGLFQGGQTVGSGGGDGSLRDLISKIAVGSGQRLIDYNFCEIPPASISGTVYVELDTDCEQDSGESGIAGTKVELLDAAGNVVATTRTDEQGRYRFEGLAPARYSVRETQPSGFFHGGQTAGTAGGDASNDDLISAITIGAGQILVDYNFCEVPPSRLSGTVFQDGPDIETLDGTLPDDLSSIRDAKRTADDRPIAGVVLELRNGIDGRPILGEHALPGVYPPGPIRTTTDAQGRYEFLGLRGRASYAVFEVHPAGFVDSIDRPGTTGGIAFNPGQVVPQFVLQTLAVQPRNDAIVRIPLGIGQSSEFNDFSEVRVTRLPPPPELIPPPPALPPETPRISLTPPPALPPPWLIVAPEPTPIYGAHPGMTWHLSVIDAGVPRGLSLPESAEVEWTRTAFVLANEPWSTHRLDAGDWVIATTDQLARRPADDADPGEGRKIRFGMPGAIPIAGDFNGDGLCEVGVYFRGEWFIDLNGNGEWDEGDLWAKLGDEQDLPVVGDWDGDGKDDIGIYGPEWQGDRRAIAAEPGLPDLTNIPKDKPKNVPPDIDEATDGHRLLKLTRNGRPRADLIDHVFRYGRSQDLPVAGDWDGDGIDSIGTFCDGHWVLDYNGDGRNLGQEYVASFGQAGDLPVIGDFDGDGIDEIGVFRAGTWYIDSNHNRELDAHDKVFQLGGAGDRPVVGDWDGDGIDDPGVYHDAPTVAAPPAATTARK